MRPECHPEAGISLRRLLPDAVFHGADDVWVTGCSSDARHCRRGDLFVPLAEGGRLDGDELQEAARRGAVAVLAEENSGSQRLPTCIVSDVRRAFGQVCQLLAGAPTERLKVIAVSGSFGKTTTALLTTSVIEASGRPSGLVCSLGYYDGQERGAAAQTTPSAPVLARWLARMESHECSHAVVEVSARGLAEGAMSGVHLDVACFTHLAGSAGDARHAPRAASLLCNLGPTGFAVVNADDPICESLVAHHDGPTISIGVEKPAEITATILDSCASEQTFLLHAGDETATVRTSLVGRHNVYNCLTAAAVGCAYGAPLTEIVRGLERVPRIPRRLERVECGQPYRVYVDCARSPGAAGRLVAALRPLVAGRILCVYERPLGPVASTWTSSREIGADMVLDVPTAEDGAQRAALRAERIARALDEAREGDAVLITGSRAADRERPLVETLLKSGQGQHRRRAA